MNYLPSQTWTIIIGLSCLISSILFILIYIPKTLTKEILLKPIHLGRPITKLCNLSTTEKIIWHNNDSKNDLFDYHHSKNLIKNLPNLESHEPPISLPLEKTIYPIQLKGWTLIKEKIVFIFSFIETGITLLGTIGDSFENPYFTILSFDYKQVENNSNKYSIPLVTILDNKNNERIVLIPDMYKEYFNENH